MSDLDQQLKEAFALADLLNFKWLTDAEIKALPKPIKKGSMTVPLNKETFEEMRDATVFTGHWATQAHQVMKRARLFRVEVRMYQIGVKEPIQAMAVMKRPDTVHVMWKAIGEASSFIMSENKDAEWDANRSKAVIKV